MRYTEDVAFESFNLAPLLYLLPVTTQWQLERLRACRQFVGYVGGSTLDDNLEILGGVSSVMGRLDTDSEEGIGLKELRCRCVVFLFRDSPLACSVFVVSPRSLVVVVVVVAGRSVAPRCPPCCSGW